MAKLYTLQEAADRLGLTPEVFRRKLKTEWVKDLQMIPGNPPHFRAADVDEFARVLGAASDPGLAPGPFGSPAAEDAVNFSFAADDSSEVFTAPPGASDEPLFVAPPEEDIHSGPAVLKTGSDSDVRLEAVEPPPRADDRSGPTEEIAIDLSGPASAVIKPSSGSGRLSAPKSGSKLAGPESGKAPKAGAAKADDSSSEFELSLDPSNDSFELEMAEGDGSEDVDLGGLLLPDPKGGQSGINLGKPADSGLSLERGGPKTGPLNRPSGPADSDSDIDFELSLDSGDSLPNPAGRSGGKAGGRAVPPAAGPDSDSEFELTLDDSSSGFSEIVEDARAGGGLDAEGGEITETDFELPAMGDDDSSADLEADTGLEGSDEFEVDEVELVDDVGSGEDVVLIDAEDGEAVEEVDLLDGDSEEGPSASGALRGVRRDLDDGYGDPRGAVVVPVAAAPAKWGALPAVVLFMTLPLMFLGTLMSYEMVRGMWGYHQPSAPGNLVVRGVAESLLGLKPGD